MQNTSWLKLLDTLMAKHCLIDIHNDFQYLSLEEAWFTYLHLLKIEELGRD